MICPKKVVDLLNYYESIPINYIIDQNFDGLRRMIINSNIPSHRQSLLFSLFEQPKSNNKEDRMSSFKKVKALLSNASRIDKSGNKDQLPIQEETRKLNIIINNT